MNRVIAVCCSDDKEVQIYGYGTYLGKRPCPLLCGIPNPCIELEDGNLVWGCECWWGDADRYEKEILNGRSIKIVPLERGENNG